MNSTQPERLLSPERAAAATALLVSYALLIDSRRARPWARLFGDSGVLVVGDRTIQGEDPLAEFATRSTPGTHVQGEAILRETAGGIVRAQSAFVFVRNHDRGLISGWYEDVLHPQGEGYTFARRTIDIRAKTPDEGAGTR